MYLRQEMAVLARMGCFSARLPRPSKQTKLSGSWAWMSLEVLLRENMICSVNL